MWNSLKEDTLVMLCTWQCKCYLGRIVENTWEQLVLKDVEVYELGETTTIHKEDFVYIPKEDIEIMAPVRAMALHERLK